MINKKTILIIGCFFFVAFCFPSEPAAQDQTKTIRWLKTASDTEKIKFWTQLSSEINKLYPMNVDSETLLINSAPQANGMTWNYKTINYQYSDRSKKGWDDFLSVVANESIKRFCTTPDSLFFRESNASIKINYYDRDGKYIGVIQFEAGKDCAK